MSGKAELGALPCELGALPVLNASFPQAKIGFLTHPASTDVLDLAIDLARPKVYSSGEIRHEWKRVSTARVSPAGILRFTLARAPLISPGLKKTGGSLRCFAWIRAGRLSFWATEKTRKRPVGTSPICPPPFSIFPGSFSWPLMAEGIGRGLDSAGAHIAAARDVPAVCIYAGISHLSIFPSLPPDGPRSCLSHALFSLPHHGRMRGMECVRLTPPHAVFAQIQSLMKVSARSSDLPGSHDFINDQSL